MRVLCLCAESEEVYGALLATGQEQAGNEVLLESSFSACAVPLRARADWSGWELKWCDSGTKRHRCMVSVSMPQTCVVSYQDHHWSSQLA